MKNKNSISVIGIRGYPSEFKGTSGVEVYVERVVNELVKKNKKFYFLLYTKKPYTKKVRTSQQIQITKISVPLMKVGESLWYGLTASFLASFDQSKVVWYQGTGIAFFSFFPRLAGKKVVVTIHGLDWQRQKWSLVESKLFFWASKIALIFSHETVTVSQEMQIQVKKIFQVSSQIALPGIERLKLPKNSRAILKKLNLKPNSYFLSVSRLVPEKRIEWIIDAFLKIKTDQLLIIIGSHGNLPQYEKTLRAKYQSSRIKWLGFTSNSLRNILLKYSSVYVLASAVEGGNPLSFLEAVALKKTCIVPTQSVTENFSQLPFVTFFKKNQKEDLQRKMQKISQLQKKKKNSGERLKESKNKTVSVLKKYSWQITAKTYQEVFNNF
jgi:glycosyltransferase involved in cell wall biosynthesis